MPCKKYLHHFHILSSYQNNFVENFQAEFDPEEVQNYLKKKEREKEKENLKWKDLLN